MNLQKYFEQLRTKEAEIGGKDVFITSLATPDGGKEGVITQVSKRAGSQLIVEGKARLSTEAEVEAHLKAQGELRAQIESQAFAHRIQVQVVSDGKGGARELKSGRE